MQKTFEIIKQNLNINVAFRYSCHRWSDVLPCSRLREIVRNNKELTFVYCVLIFFQFTFYGFFFFSLSLFAFTFLWILLLLIHLRLNFLFNSPFVYSSSPSSSLLLPLPLRFHLFMDSSSPHSSHPLS